MMNKIWKTVGLFIRLVNTLKKS